MSKKKKIPSQEVKNRKNNKHPHSERFDNDGISGQPVFRFKHLDLEFDFPESGLPTQSGFHDMLNGLRLHEGQNFSEAGFRGSHDIETKDLISEAKYRLVEKGLDYDTVYSIRLSGKKRIFCIRIKSTYYVLWWDPEHKICPSNKN